MKIEVYAGMDQQTQTSNERAGMIGKALRIFFDAKNFPCYPKQQDDES